MAQTKVTENFDCTKEQFYKIISDYEKYPEFLSDVKNIEITESNGNIKLVEYTVSIIKSFNYILKMTEIPNESITWEFHSGDLFKKMDGGWELEEENGKVSATYTIDAGFKMFVPGSVAKAIIEVNLPNMMKAYKKRIQELYK